MRKIILSSLLLAFLLTSCGSPKTNETKTAETDVVSDSAKTHACPVHPEITGKKGDKCPDCGMELTEVAKATVDSTKMK